MFIILVYKGFYNVVIDNGGGIEVHSTVNRGTVLHTQYGSPWKGGEDTEVR